MELKDLLKLIKQKRRQQYIGRKLYYYKPCGKSKENKYINGQVYTEDKEDGQEVYTNWSKVLINQKIDYSLSKPVTIDNIPPEFDTEDILDKASLNASMDSKAWVQLIINNHNKKLDWIVVLDSLIIPIFDNNNKYITTIIKFWEEKENKDDDKSSKILKVQIWDNEKVTELLIKNDKIVSQKTMSHYLEKLMYNDKEEAINPKGFGFIPFIPLYNNKNHESDIEGLDILLKCYNEIATGFINNIRKFQEMIMKLKGYGGQNLEEFERILKKYRVVPVDENGDFDYLKVEVPVEARSVLLELCRKNIFIIGRGVDPNDDLGGSNITNVLIKSKYANLDMKASDSEKQIRIFYKQLISMINAYYNIAIKPDIKFNRSQIFNESEIVDNCVKSMGLVSTMTILEKHPFVDNLELELERLKEEKEQQEEENKKQLEQDKNIDFGTN